MWTSFSHNLIKYMNKNHTHIHTHIRISLKRLNGEKRQRCNQIMQYYAKASYNYSTIVVTSDAKQSVQFSSIIQIHYHQFLFLIRNKKYSFSRYASSGFHLFGRFESYIPTHHWSDSATSRRTCDRRKIIVRVMTERPLESRSIARSGIATTTAIPDSWASSTYVPHCRAVGRCRTSRAARIVL